MKLIKKIVCVWDPRVRENMAIKKLNFISLKFKKYNM